MEDTWYPTMPYLEMERKGRVPYNANTLTRLTSFGDVFRRSADDNKDSKEERASITPIPNHFFQKALCLRSEYFKLTQQSRVNRPKCVGAKRA